MKRVETMVRVMMVVRVMVSHAVVMVPHAVMMLAHSVMSHPLAMVHSATTMSASVTASAVGIRDRGARQRNRRYSGQQNCKFLHYVPPRLK